jgi:1-(5-phosphoribosyl)-5-[(5-phosphoribosylamino)methylideneamino] imidazole-4-carboxamide isomerase/N-(5'phosphoribosyl)anthranilate isomerase
VSKDATPPGSPAGPGAPLVLLPAVDVTGGQATQLVRGVAGSGKVYGEPLAAALAWRDQGASWVHLVDLDAAFGRGDNRALLADVVAALDIDVELAGGIRDDASLAAALATGATRVVIGTAALEDPGWCARIIGEHGDRVTIGLDVRLSPDGAHRLSARGWTRDGGLLWDALARLDAAGCARYVVTDINRDGTLTGPNTHLLLDVAARTPAPVVASGGISTLADVAALATLTDRGIEGAIIGTALYEKAFTLPDALRVAAGQ